MTSGCCAERCRPRRAERSRRERPGCGTRRPGVRATGNYGWPWCCWRSWLPGSGARSAGDRRAGRSRPTGERLRVGPGPRLGPGALRRLPLPRTVSHDARRPTSRSTGAAVRGWRRAVRPRGRRREARVRVRPSARFTRPGSAKCRRPRRTRRGACIHPDHDGSAGPDDLGHPCTPQIGHRGSTGAPRRCRTSEDEAAVRCGRRADRAANSRRWKPCWGVVSVPGERGRLPLLGDTFRERVARKAGVGRYNGPGRSGLNRESDPLVSDMHRAVKRALDPAGILKPGKVFAMDNRWQGGLPTACEPGTPRCRRGAGCIRCSGTKGCGRPCYPGAEPPASSVAAWSHQVRPARAWPRP
ncbi:FAD-linked oxidase C-terminal domain-containing protein [Embleya sp. NPDC059259]|uniref:FAD-linked oxidase C-terminal domain-containing protein n=1 Tax=unclassified Embleya TaxID=2699296 RepID=UPI0036A90C75